MTTRRDFIQKAGLIGAGLSLGPYFARANSFNGNSANVSANDKINVGV
ncbi:MAG: twin-arginine translocation signal domain-containing protein, partial [Prevotellaceae bacterium]|nr:twin-arginine translocation signal domain-containing protein [Prevotellaceae bacterium]